MGLSQRPTRSTIPNPKLNCNYFYIKFLIVHKDTPNKGSPLNVLLNLSNKDEYSFKQFIEHVVCKVEFINTNMGEVRV